jgi:acetate CoA/acetoacetate CoA-transferase beta subunit
VIAFPEGRATLLETGPGVAVADVLAATEAELRVAADVRPMPLGTRAAA